MADAPGEDLQQAKILSKHLDPGYSADFDGTTPENAGSSGSSAVNLSTNAESSLRLQGGDITRDLYAIKTKAQRAKLNKRAATFSHLPEFEEPDHDDIPVADQMAPGGFRRQYLERQSRRVSFIAAPVTRNFVSFLDLYGNFAGEDLEETDDDEDSAVEDEEDDVEQTSERRPLLGRRKSSRKLRAQGDASDRKAFFTLMKAFVGTGIMFLPKAFKNGGMLFSSITLIVVSIVTMMCFQLLLKCRARFGGGYGEFGEAVGGRRLRQLILTSITISQIGFVCAGLIFAADNLASFLDAVVKTKSAPLSTNALIGIQIILLIPMSFIRNISKLSPAAILADVFILVGVVYIFWFDVSSIAQMGHFHPTVDLFNPRDFTLTIGSAIFTFEGIGLILPIQASMKHPENFNKLLAIVMLIITVVFTAVGVLCYGTFGDRVSVEIITNFPQDSVLVNVVQFLYAIAVMVGSPVQLFPALRIIESKVFGHRSGKANTLTKWKKNAFRAAMVVFTGLIAAVGASDLDKFVALIGSFACVPLVYIYPAFLHYKGLAETRWEKIGDLFMMVVGLCAMVYTTSVTVARWAET
ncbi:transmembrane amino acid transporter protein-domain-containing protein [Massariosphaeria phaeospora]|uniref:Transmembrane amino acid transporter protein-domain-containing protein n=1 Tax=Massariosphaeria phaeospora TaxID=100035 RepID=A0A7C8I039_9PLEO|nr:transmembrane amino acid transporter protein-domain-containing protein [Massariosphaeria phaeospora]